MQRRVFILCLTAASSGLTMAASAQTRRPKPDFNREAQKPRPKEPFNRAAKPKTPPNNNNNGGGGNNNKRPPPNGWTRKF